MSKARAITKYIRVSPRKGRLAASLIRKLPVESAREQLTVGHTKACRHLLKTLNSAIANAEANHDMRREELVVLEVRVDEGPTLKRSRSRCRGGRSSIMKRTSHMLVVVGQEQGDL